MTASLAALGTPRRREILRLVWREELPAGAIHRALPDVTFGAVSQHLKVLKDVGLVACRAEGRQRFYRARRSALGPLRGLLESMWEDALYRLKLQAELEEARRGPRAPKGRRTTGREPERRASWKHRTPGSRPRTRSSSPSSGRS